MREESHLGFATSNLSLSFKHPSVTFAAAVPDANMVLVDVSTPGPISALSAEVLLNFRGDFNLFGILRHKKQKEVQKLVKFISVNFSFESKRVLFTLKEHQEFLTKTEIPLISDKGFTMEVYGNFKF